MKKRRRGNSAEQPVRYRKQVTMTWPRRIWTLLTLASVGACLFVLFLWFHRSRLEGATLVRIEPVEKGASSIRQYFIFSYDGGLIVMRSSLLPMSADEIHNYIATRTLVPGLKFSIPASALLESGVQSRPQFQWNRPIDPRSSRIHTVLERFDESRVPLWCISLFFAILPTLWLGTRLRVATRLRMVWITWLLRPLHYARVDRRRCCRVCGYDLRATPDRCPECGTRVG